MTNELVLSIDVPATEVLVPTAVIATDVARPVEQADAVTVVAAADATQADVDAGVEV